MLIFLVVLSLTLISICTTALRVTNYNETEAKILLNLAAGAYSLQPQDCVKNTLPSREEWIIYSSGSTTCDVIQSSCAFYTIRSDILKEIIIIFRGTKTRKQLFLEGWQSLNNGKNFLGVGMVNPYFSKAINKIWSNIEPLLRDPIFRSYRVTFTGHSLGGALASLAAVRTVVQNLRDGNEIKLVTFGEPRIGDYQFAMYHSTHIPYSFRVVNRADIIPHLPPCKKNASIANSEIDESKPCLATNNSFPYHHGVEIWYPYGMHENAKYYECLNTPINEDFECSDSLLFDIKHLKTFIKDHRYYFNVKVPAYGKKGCKNFTNDSSEFDDAFIPLNVSQQLTSDSSSSFQKIQTGISNIFDALKSLIKFF